MQKNKLFNITLLLICLGFVAACQEKTKSTVRYEYINNPNSDSGGRGNDGSGGTDNNNGGSTGVSPYQIYPEHVIFKPAQNINTFLWSSKTHLAGKNYNQNIFYSNSKVSIRVMPIRPVDDSLAGKIRVNGHHQITENQQFSGGTRDGSICHFATQDFSKMSITVEIIGYKGEQGSRVTFYDVAKNTWSKPQEFPHLPQNTSDPFDIRLLMMQKPDGGYINPYECFSFAIEFATDSTNDLPSI